MPVIPPQGGNSGNISPGQYSTCNVKIKNINLYITDPRKGKKGRRIMYTYIWIKAHYTNLLLYYK